MKKGPDEGGGMRQGFDGGRFSRIPQHLRPEVVPNMEEAMTGWRRIG